jgi:hypothetical protein
LLGIALALTYAAAKGFDISSNSFGQLDKNFSGFIFIRQWDETPVKLFAVENGKRTRDISLQKRPLKQGGTAVASSTSSPDDCGWEQVEVTRRWCIVAAENLGENPPPASECSNWHEETAIEWMWVCHPVDDGGGTVNCNTLTGMSYDDCMCYYFNVCGNGGGGEEDPNDCANINLQAQLNDAVVMGNIVENVDTYIDDSSRAKDIKWQYLSIQNGIGGRDYFSHEKAMTKRTGQDFKWSFMSVSHDSLSTESGFIAYNSQEQLTRWRADIYNISGGFMGFFYKNRARIDMEVNVKLTLDCGLSFTIEQKAYPVISDFLYPYPN